MASKRYRLSKKGKIVIFALSLIIFIAIYFHLNSFFNHSPSNTEEIVNQNDNNNQNSQEVQNNTIDDNHIKEYTISLYFEPGETSLNIESQSMLDLFIEMDLIENSKIRIEGNCATLHKTPLNDRERKMNYAFALKRAEQVAQYLKNTGIPMQRMKVISNGSDCPVNSNKTWSERKLNRRVDIIFQMAE